MHSKNYVILIKHAFKMALNPKYTIFKVIQFEMVALCVFFMC